MAKKEIQDNTEGRPIGQEFNGNPVFKTRDDKYYVVVGAARFYCGERRFDKLGTAKKREDEARDEQTKIQDEAVAKQMKTEGSLKEARK